jgi:hypothetical protein
MWVLESLNRLWVGYLTLCSLCTGHPQRDPTHECKWGFQVEVWLQHKNQHVKGDPILSKLLKLVSFGTKEKRNAHIFVLDNIFHNNYK